MESLLSLYKTAHSCWSCKLLCLAFKLDAVFSILQVLKCHFLSFSFIPILLSSAKRTEPKQLRAAREAAENILHIKPQLYQLL